MSDILILDVETTGTDTETDEVIELAIQFGFPAGVDDLDVDGVRPRGHCDRPALRNGGQLVWRFKPTKPVGASAEIHHITDEMLAASPPFSRLAPRIGEIIDQAEVLIGYNVGFDLAMLDAEFRRAGVPFPDLAGKCIVDPLALWRRLEPRTLADAHLRFVGAPLEGAHAAGVDIAATGAVLLGMVRDFGLEAHSWEELMLLADPERASWLGHTPHFQWSGDGRVVFTFGKHKGCGVHDDGVKGYLRWIVDKGGFPAHVKLVAEAAMRLKADAFTAWAAKRWPPPASGA